MNSGRRKFIALLMLFALVSYSKLLWRATSVYDFSVKDDRPIFPPSENLPRHQHHANTSRPAKDGTQNHVPQQSNLSNTSRAGDMDDFDEETIDTDDPLANQNPQGEKWSWPHHEQGHAEYWWQNSNTCFGVHNICRSSKNRWFYFHHYSNSSKQFQPSFSLKYVPYSYRRGLFANIRIKMTVDSSSSLLWEKLVPSDSKNGTQKSSDQQQCDISSVDQHVVLHAMHNDMIGEFYDRTMGPLLALFTAQHHQSGDSDVHVQSNSTTFLAEMQSINEDIQFYLHIPFLNKKMLDAHRLLLSGMIPYYHNKHSDERRNNSLFRWAKPALDLVKPQQRQCQCYKKVVFCGYNVYMEQFTKNASKNNDESLDATNVSPPPNNRETSYALWPGSGIHSDRQPTREQIRSYIIENIEAHFPLIKRDVMMFRKKLLQERHLIPQNYAGDTKEWIFVGLAQRALRRTWINLSSSIQACSTTDFSNNANEIMSKVVCLEVNVENTTSPLEQFILHRSLDGGLIGVHGAQMTHALFLRDFSHVLELLPWVPNYSRGAWVQSTGSPTPIGNLFNNTRLNHVGYSLGRNSVPLCQDSVSEEGEKACFESQRNFHWADRNFKVDPNAVVQFVNKFVIPMKQRTVCTRLLQAQRDTWFTLYNVWCLDDGGLDAGGNITNTAFAVRHFYRKELSDAVREQNVLPMCPFPKSSWVWNYYYALVYENAKTAKHARELTPSPNRMSNDVNQTATPLIPHRLIFTHKDNLFDCSLYESNTTPPELANLAANAKATVNIYSRMWPDVEFVFLTNHDCIRALNLTEPRLVGWFNSGRLEGMFKADLCRAAYIYLHGGYYFDVDLLVVRPFVAPHDAKFVTARGSYFPEEGLFQAFLAAEKGSSIVFRSLEIMLDALYQQRPQGKYLGPTALMEAWMEVEQVHHPLSTNETNGIYLLAEVKLNDAKAMSQYKNLSKAISKDRTELLQQVPFGFGDKCQFSSGACNFAVVDSHDETLYFYSRVLGTRWCGQIIHKHGEC